MVLRVKPAESTRSHFARLVILPILPSDTRFAQNFMNGLRAFLDLGKIRVNGWRGRY